MALELSSFLKVLEDSYSAYYTIIKDDLPSNLPIVMRADYLQFDERYWLTKSIQIWGNETNEFFYLFSAEKLDSVDTINACVQYALDEGLPRVKPHAQHQYTNIKVVFVANEFSSEVISTIKKWKFSKSYNHSLWGYTELHVAGVDVNDEKVMTNWAGKDLKKYFKKLFAAQHKH